MHLFVDTIIKRNIRNTVLFISEVLYICILLVVQILKIKGISKNSEIMHWTPKSTFFMFAGIF